ncbi:MAG: HAD family hydrolase [Clostridiales bacterium]|nr:HAD family hydrolase [Clostridiales bacterium]
MNSTGIETKKPLRLIVTDLDNSLLRRDKSISAYTKSVWEQCRTKGVFTAFATARSESASKRFMDWLNPDAMISNGGALVRAGDRVVYRAAMSREITNRLLQALLQSPGAGYITVDTDEGYFVNQAVEENTPGWIDYLPAFPKDFSQGLDCDAYKVSAQLPDEDRARDILTVFPMIDVIPFYGENWYRYAAKGADKWDGVKALAAHLGLGRESVVAFGDDYSDLEMIRQCGVGVAVANGISEVKAAADDVCADCDEDGIAHWIEVHCL